MGAKHYGPKRKVSKPSIPPEDAGLFGGSTDSTDFAYDQLDIDTLRQLIKWVAVGGGIVTLGSANAGTGLYVAVRRGDTGRSFVLETPDQFIVWARPIIEAWKVLHLASQSPVADA